MAIAKVCNSRLEGVEAPHRVELLHISAKHMADDFPLEKYLDMYGNIRDTGRLRTQHPGHWRPYWPRLCCRSGFGLRGCSYPAQSLRQELGTGNETVRGNEKCWRVFWGAVTEGEKALP